MPLGAKIWCDYVVVHAGLHVYRLFTETSDLPDTQPPAIKLMSPFIPENDTFQTNTKEFDLIGEVTDESGVKFVSVNSDIRNINEAGIFSSRLVLEPGKNQIRLVTSDVLDNLAEQLYTVEYIPPVPTLSDKISESSKYYGLIIGIDNYRDPDLPDLQNPVKDAGKLHELLISRYSFHENEMVILRDATRNDIVGALDYLANIVTPEDNVLIFYAGHGTWDERANVGYLFPADA